MPKTCEWSSDLRELVIKHHLNGDSIRTIVKKVDLSHSTIHSIIKKWNDTGSVMNRLGRGRKRHTTSRVDRIIHRTIISNRRKAAPDVAIDLKRDHNISITAQTVRNRMHEVGYRGCIARKKPFIKKLNKRKRVCWAREHFPKPKEFWNSILWSDESKFNLFGSDGRQIVWRQSHESMKTECLKPTVKYGGGSVMVWGCMSGSGVGNLVLIEGIMYKEQYEKILNENIKKSAKKLKLRSFLFQQVNDPKHTAGTISQWFVNNRIDKLKWPPQSPDLNPIEHIWDELERRLKPHSPKNKNELWNIMQKEWNGIGREVTSKLVDSMPNRLQEVMKHHGGPTRY
ncbi:unnamed protein product [Rotaria socialis]|uniref:Transposase n=1 Tax=Rotaria socialis TaxID=392032 RepID=A0A817V4K6_9BILA|nr:unnamed protein product [Rotaria socialis]CAF3338321.1 unnamed protein product [Rotaria socialis]CAF4527452.1 unnamed protein product [Rotaria socialis]CAF4530553.1 unnamed protein product [Rotaria socialis]